MFPIRDHNPSSRVPFVTYALMAMNIAIFLLYYPGRAEYEILSTFSQWALIPGLLADGEGYLRLVSSMFLHGGWAHLFGNMLFLWIFGDNLEDCLGHFGYLTFYLVCGIGAGLAQFIASPFSNVPMVGASGAIAGVMGGYLLLYPKARVDILFIFIIFFRIIPVPAWLMLGLWFAFQFFAGITSDLSAGGVAYWAHAGGFILGVLLIIPAWLRRGAQDYWQRTEGHPPHPEAEYKFAKSPIPRVRRKRR